MKSWVFSFVGLSCLICAVTVPASAQQGAKSDVQKAGEQKQNEPKVGKVLKFKLEWITTNNASTQNKSVSTEAITVLGIDGQTTVTTNPSPSGDNFRRVTIHPDIQADGSYLVDLSVSEFSKDYDRDIPRLGAVVKLKANESLVVQDRAVKTQNYEFETVFLVTPVAE